MDIRTITSRGGRYPVAIRALILCLLLSPLQARDLPFLPLAESEESQAPIGSGDGRIHVIPSLHPYSIKNGETLTVSAVIRSDQPVLSVTANLGHLDTVVLQPNHGLGGMSEDGTIGIWTAEWIGHSLEQKIYAATLTVTDITGHSWTDHSLVFSDPAAGFSDPGANIYPDGGMRITPTSTALISESMLGAAVIDTVHGYGYFGTFTMPSMVIKVNLKGGGSVVPDPIASVLLEPGEGFISCGVIDVPRGYALFGTSTSPARVIRVLLGEGTAPPVRNASLTFPGIGPHNSNLTCAAYNPDAGRALFASLTGGITQILTGNVGDPLQSVGSPLVISGMERPFAAAYHPASDRFFFAGTGITTGTDALLAKIRADGVVFGLVQSPVSLGPGEAKAIAIDSSRSLIFVGVNNLQASRVAKLALNAASTAPSLLSTLDLPPGFSPVSTGFADEDRGVVVFGTNSNVAGLVRISAGTANAESEVMQALSLGDPVSKIWTSIHDSSTGQAWFGTETSPAYIQQVSIGGPQEFMIDPSILQLPGEGRFSSAVYHPATDRVLLGTNTERATIVKIAPGAGGSTPSRIAALLLQPGEGFLRSAVIDQPNGYAYFAGGGSSGVFVKVRLNAAGSIPTRIGSVNLGPAMIPTSAVIDPENGFAYLGTSSKQVVKVSLGTGNNSPQFVSAITLTGGSTAQALASAVIDPGNGFAYFGSGSSASNIPGSVHKVALGAGSNSPSQIGVVTLQSNENNLACAVIDPVSGFALFAGGGNPAPIIKINLGVGTNPPTRSSVTLLSAGSISPQTAVFNPQTGHAYFCSILSSPRISKVAMGLGNNPPTLLSNRTITGVIPTGGGSVDAAAIDENTGNTIWATNGETATIFKTVQGEFGNSFVTRRGAASFNTGENNPLCAVIDTTNGYAYYGMATAPGIIVKVALGSGNNPPTRVSALTLNSGENNPISAVIDLAANRAYFGLSTNPGRVVKIALGTTNAAPTRVGALTLPAGNTGLNSAIIDPAAGMAWFGTSSSPANVVKVNLGTANVAPSFVGSTTLLTGENNLRCAVIDIPSQRALFGTETLPGRIVKINLGTGINPPSRIGAITLNAGENNLRTADYDAANQYAYFGTNTFPARVVKVRMGLPNSLPSRVGALTFETNENGAGSILLDPVHGVGFVGLNFDPSRIVYFHMGLGDAAPQRLFQLILQAPEVNVRSGVIDPLRGHAWFGTVDPGNVSRAVKISLGTAIDPVIASSPIQTQGVFDEISCVVTNTSGTHALFGTNTTPSKVIKVALGTGTATPTLLGVLELPTALRTAVINSSEGFAYFAGEGSNVYMVNFGTGNNLPTLVATTPILLGGEGTSIESSVINPVTNQGYFGTNLATARIVRVQLGPGSNPPTRIAALQLETNEGGLGCAVIDVNGGHAYFGTSSTVPRIVKVGLGDPGGPPIRRGALQLALADSHLSCAVIDPGRGVAYFGSNAATPTTGRIIKIALGAGTSPPTLVDTTLLKEGVELNVLSAIINTSSNFGVFGTNSGHLVKYHLGTSGQLPTRMGSTKLANAPVVGAARTTPNFGFFATAASPSTITKIDTGAAFVPLTAGPFVELFNGVGSRMLLDPEDRYAYVMSAQVNPRTLIKLRLNQDAGPATVVGVTKIPGLGSNVITEAVLAKENNSTVFASINRIIKAHTGEGDAPPIHVGTILLPFEDGAITSAVYHPGHGHLYLGNSATSGRIIKVGLGNPLDPPVRLGALDLPTGEINLTSAVIDPDSGHAWFGANDLTRRIVKIGLTPFDLPPVYLNSLSLAGTGFLTAAVIHRERESAYFFSSNPPRLVWISLGEGTNPPTLNANIPLLDSDDEIRDGFIDIQSNVGYFLATSDTPGIVKFDLRLGVQPPVRLGNFPIANQLHSPTIGFDSSRGVAHMLQRHPVLTPSEFRQVILGYKGAINATRFTLPEQGEVNEVRFFSHAAKGNVRLALYSDGSPRTLLWQSSAIPNLAEGAEIKVPINEGNPDFLILPPGIYWAAWQVDTLADVPSFTEGNLGDGFTFRHPFGPAPSIIQDSEATPTNDRWTMYIIYNDDQESWEGWAIH